MMWPVGDFHDGSNRLSAEKIEFAEIFRSLGREDMADTILGCRKYQRLLSFFEAAVSVERSEFESQL